VIVVAIGGVVADETDGDVVAVDLVDGEVVNGDIAVFEHFGFFESMRSNRCFLVLTLYPGLRLVLSRIGCPEIGLVLLKIG